MLYCDWQILLHVELCRPLAEFLSFSTIPLRLLHTRDEWVTRWKIKSIYVITTLGVLRRLLRDC